LHTLCSVGDGDGLRAAFLQRVDQARLAHLQQQSEQRQKVRALGRTICGPTTITRQLREATKRTRSAAFTN
jgi:hypothetical protein